MEYIGKGIYTINDAQKLTGISKYKISRWTNGYTYKKNSINIAVPSVYNNDYDEIESHKAISFLDLIEILFINSFEKYKISLQSIRKAATYASKILKTKHPFAKKAFYTDGKTILARIADENNDPELLDLLKKQYQIDSIIMPHLYKCIDFNKYELAEKWWPLGKENGIVVDPSRNFGKPIINNYNIRIETIIDLYKAGHSIDEIAEWYEIDKSSINSALHFNSNKCA